MPLTSTEREWYYNEIAKVDPHGDIASVDRDAGIVSYSSELRSDESSQRDATPEELVHALAICMLVGNNFEYRLDKLYHEKYFAHGSKGSLADEVDLLIYDEDSLPYAMWEFKSSEEFKVAEDDAIRHQLFGTAPLAGAPRLLVYATIHPQGVEPTLQLRVIDHSTYPSYDGWLEAEKPVGNTFPKDYKDPDYLPFSNGGSSDLRFNCTQADFRAAAATFHNEFFGEHPDNVLYVSLVKCLLAKILDERNTKKGQPYQFQIFYKAGKPETATEVYGKVNSLYATAYQRYIDSTSNATDEIDPREFPPERVKTVVSILQGMSITRGAALHGDVIGAFFEEILRIGFKQDKGMYFTHDNLVHFMLEAVDLRGLTVKRWESANHPENRLPYVIDPACGAGTFLLRAMGIVGDTIRSKKDELVVDQEAEDFFRARMSEPIPNYWAENFLYGYDPKFVMAITAKVNMVLHGDGSAHIFKDDAFKPLHSLSDARLRPLGDDSIRSIPRSRYSPDACETFDLVVSNPPFGVTLSSETRNALTKTFSLDQSSPSEALFIERCFQLLRPGGRLAMVVPESLLNTAESIDVRLFLYRTFWIRSIVSLPRNLFVDTPTLTSLLFAQKKSPEEIARWDEVWNYHETRINEKVKETSKYLARAVYEETEPSKVQRKVLKLLHPIVDENSWFLKRGKDSEVRRLRLPTTIKSVKQAVDYYKDTLRLAGFGFLLRSHTFANMIEDFDYHFPTFVVDEVGYKLSKRKERSRPNKLCRFLGSSSEQEYPNLHLADERTYISVDTDNPERVLDYIAKAVTWT